MVSWFKEQFAHKESLEAQSLGISTEHILDQQASAIAPGADGLILQPYWSPGVRYPGPEARGAIIGFNDSHTRAHIYRALLEGIAFGLRSGKEKMESRSRVPITELYVSGGGSQSQTALQITADVFNLPVQVPQYYETSGLGAAINAAVNRGVYPNYASAVKAMCRTRTTLQPIDANVKLYDAMFTSVYQQLYQRLSPLYKALKAINP
jgi:sugar (pentulose or hexulose) kinase